MADDLLANNASSPMNWHKITSINPIERLNRENTRRTNALAFFPIIRLVGAIRVKFDDGMDASNRSYAPSVVGARLVTILELT